LKWTAYICSWYLACSSDMVYFQYLECGELLFSCLPLRVKTQRALTEDKNQSPLKSPRISRDLRSQCLEHGCRYIYVCIVYVFLRRFLSNAHVSVGSRYARTNVYIYLALKITYVLQRKRDYVFNEKFFMHVKIRNLEHKGNSHYLSRFFRSIIIEKINKKYTRWSLCVLISRNLSEIVFQILKIGSHANMIRYGTSWSLFMHALRVTAVQRRKTTTYIMRQIVEYCSSVTPKSGPGNQKIFGMTKESLIERYDRSLLHPSDIFKLYIRLY